MSTPQVFNLANKQPVTLQQDEPTIWQADAAKDGDACVHAGHLSLAADVALESLTHLLRLGNRSFPYKAPKKEK